MSRWAERHGAELAWVVPMTVALTVLTSATTVAGYGHAAAAAARTAAAAPTGAPPAAATGSGASGTAPVLDLNGPVLDLVFSTSSLDGSLTDQSGQAKRVLTLSADVLFAFGSAALAPAASSRLAEVAADVRTGAGGRTLTVRIDGYTDAKGTVPYNAKLSNRRAAAVAAALRSRLSGVPVTFGVAGHGAADPVAPNTVGGKDNPKGRARNRRVTVSFPQPPA